MLRQKILYSKGTSLIEVFVSLAIISPLAIGSINLLKNNLIHNKKLNNNYVADKNINKSYYLLNKIIHDLDLHRFYISPVIHKNGKIKNSQGELNKINFHKRFSPKKNSTAISAYKLDLNATYVTSNTGTLLVACPKYENKFLKEKYKSFLGIYNDGFLHVDVEMRNIANSKCKEFKVTILDSIFIDNNPKFLSFIKYLIPFEEEYTLYVDENNTLRYLGHKGDNNIENQPILENLELMDLELSSLFDNKIYLLKTNLKSFSKNRFFTLSNSLSREEHYNFIFN